MIGALMSRGKARGIGFAGLVSIGNEVDLSIGEICACTLDDPDIDGYLLFLESIRNAPALREFALGAAARGKPVVAYKLGRSSAARELAVTHTGALAGEDDVASAFLADCGIARVESLEGADRGAAAGAPHADPRRSARAAARRRAHHHGRRRHHGGRSARDARRRGRAAERRRHWRASPRQGIDVTPARIVDLTVAGTRYDVDEGRARHPHHRARVRHGAGGGRLIGALPSRAGREADHRQRECRKADRGVSGARRARRAGNARARRACRASARRKPAPMRSRRRWRGASRSRRFRSQRRAEPASGRVLDELEAYALLDRLGIPRAPAVALDDDDRRSARPALPAIRSP